MRIQHKPCFGCFCYSVRNRLHAASSGMLLAGCRQTSYWLSMRSLAASMMRRRRGTPSLLKTPPRSDPPLHPVPPSRSLHTKHLSCCSLTHHCCSLMHCCCFFRFKMLSNEFGHMLANLLPDLLASPNHLCQSWLMMYCLGCVHGLWDPYKGSGMHIWNLGHIYGLWDACMGSGMHIWL